jgi:hypothetical protein
MTITIELTDEQAAALAERGVDIEAFVAREVSRVHVEAVKMRVNRAIEKSVEDKSLDEAASALSQVAKTIDDAIEAKKPPRPEPQPEPGPVEPEEPEEAEK